MKARQNSVMEKRAGRDKEGENKTKIAFYGYNMYAQIEYFYYKRNPSYELVGIYDIAYEKFKEQDAAIKNPEELKAESFDYICIFCIYESVVEDVKKFLSEKGIPKDKICVGMRQICKIENKVREDT